MTDFTYEQIIEYEDCTYDVNFEAARDWARNHNTTFEELIDRRTPSTKEVEIKGEVNHPGIYTVKWDASIQDVIEQADGLTDLANTDALALNRIVEENEVIVIGKQEENYISINTASLEQLQTLPGIGPSLASRIIEYRQERSFQSIEEIKNVKGIGDKLFEKIKEKIVL